MYNFYMPFLVLSASIGCFCVLKGKFSPPELLYRCSLRHLTGQTPFISAKTHLPPAILFISHQLDWSRTSLEKRESSVLFFQRLVLSVATLNHFQLVALLTLR